MFGHQAGGSMATRMRKLNLTDAEELAGVRRAIERITLPESGLPVKRIEYYRGADWTGEWSLFVSVVLPNGLPDSKLTGKYFRPVREAVREAIRSSDLELFAYVSFRAERTARLNAKDHPPEGSIVPRRAS